VLLSNGDAWELERCECETSDGISCGSHKTNRLLAGYEHWRCVCRAHLEGLGRI